MTMSIKNKYDEHVCGYFANEEVTALHDIARSLERYANFLKIAKKIRECADDLSQLNNKYRITRK